ARFWRVFLTDEFDADESESRAQCDDGVSNFGMGLRARRLSVFGRAGDRPRHGVFQRAVRFLRAPVQSEYLAVRRQLTGTIALSRAGVAQLAESELPKRKVAGSSPVARSKSKRRIDRMASAAKTDRTQQSATVRGGDVPTYR